MLRAAIYYCLNNYFEKRYKLTVSDIFAAVFIAINPITRTSKLQHNKDFC
jgi:hypothetical protein